MVEHIRNWKQNNYKMIAKKASPRIFFIEDVKNVLKVNKPISYKSYKVAE